MVEEQELSLQPIEIDVQRRQQQLTQNKLRRAQGRLAYEAIVADEDKARELTLRDLGCQFCIRHLLLTTSLTAAVVTVFIQVGTFAGIPLALIATFLAVYYFVHDWHVQFQAEIARRKRLWKRKYQSECTATTPTAANQRLE